MTVIYKCFKAHYIFMSDFKEKRRNSGDEEAEERSRSGRTKKDETTRYELSTHCSIFRPVIRRNHGGTPHQKIHNVFTSPLWCLLFSH